MPWTQSSYKHDERKLWQPMQDICTIIYRVTIVAWCQNEVQENGRVCQTCSNVKNIFQICLLDLDSSFPVQVRKAALKQQDNIPNSDVNKEQILSFLFQLELLKFYLTSFRYQYSSLEKHY